MFKRLSLISLALGLFLLAIVGWPIWQYQLWEWTEYQNTQTLISPTKDNVLGLTSLADAKTSDFNDKRAAEPPYLEFYLTIPKLNLNHSTVLVDNTNFDKFLAHLPGTALPGEKGNVFVSGHSAVPFLPFDQRKAIFNNLNQLKNGDQITVEALGQTFIYRVEGNKVVSPEDTYVVNPPEPAGRYLTLMTCVPPGLNTKRLIVLAKMKENQ